MKKTLLLLFALASFLTGVSTSRAAIGCTLSNPARDLRALFPTMTSYREDIRDMTTMPDGRELYEMLKTRIGSDLDPIYEAFETPYTLYSVFQDEERIGYVHGVNVPGIGGVIQLFIAVDTSEGMIDKMAFQRLESLGGKALRARETRVQFLGLSLADFYKHDYYKAADPHNPADRIAALKAPPNLPEAALPDWQATLRGLRKNLILLDFFVFDRRYDPFYERAESARQKAAADTPGQP